MYNFIEMLQYKRPKDSETEKEFCQEYLEPVFGSPDQFGNYILHVGKSPIIFMAHYDTVHQEDGYQAIEISDGVASLPKDSDSNCLGADCTSGIWLILQMIKAKVQGTYVIHYGEESGCIGSSNLANSYATWLDSKQFAISFDRYGTSEVITHQMGVRTASDAFARSFAEAVNIDLKPSPNGSYTDSNEYAHIISECANIAVGYHNQHTNKESQNLIYLEELAALLINADWGLLVSERVPGLPDDSRFWMDESLVTEEDSLVTIVEEYPDAVADLLEQFGYTPKELLETIGQGF